MLLAPSSAPSFVDLFAGCGGLSLGLFQAGWKGLFGVEKDAMAFATLQANFLEKDKKYHYEWPNWLPKQPLPIDKLFEEYTTTLGNLVGQVDLLVGGPPCQGFSSAGKRDPHDPRNELFAYYLKAVKNLMPKFILIENVRGMTIDFSIDSSENKKINYSSELIEGLSTEYFVWTAMLNAADFGVPQTRVRYLIIAQRKNFLLSWDPFEELHGMRHSFLRSKGLTEYTSSRSAISDLEVGRNGYRSSSETKGFLEIDYVGPQTKYQQYMHQDCLTNLTNTRLARHHSEITQRFQKIIERSHQFGRLNTSIGRSEREYFGLKKQALRVLDPDSPAPTITSMPDDLLHYIEPRTLTVRENARLQSFPDWFDFQGKYTTGGERRRREVPRFTQVANAVPPLLAEILGVLFFKQLLRVQEKTAETSERLACLRAV
jgi:DNA (cytosine-5)-methyltransferase 1